MRLIKLLVALLCICCILLGGCGENTSKSSETEKKAVPLELKVCSSLGKDITELLVQDFSKKYNVKATVSYVPGGKAEERMNFIKNGGFDCWLGGTAEEYFYANEYKLLEPYAAKESFKVPGEFSNRKNLWTALYMSHIALICNKNKLEQFGLYAPTTWKELLNEALKNEIVLPNYNLGGSSFGMITSVWQLQGKEAALRYAAKLNAQNPTYVANSVEAASSVYNGKKTIAVLPLGYALELEEKHKHLFATVPKDANRNLITGVGLLQAGKNEKCGQIFIDYLMSDASEELLHKNNFKYIWHVKNYPDNSGRGALVGNLNIPVDDLAWTSTYKSEIIRQWLEAK